MFGRKTLDRLARIEAALEGIAATLVKHGDALDLKTPGGLAAVNANAKDAKTAAESAFVGVQALASQAVQKPGLPEVVKAVSAHTDALVSMERAVRSATGPQPVLADAKETAAAGPAPAAAPAAKGMGARIPPKTGGKM